MEEEIEELESENCDIERRIEFDLSWTCKKCGEENTEYDIPIEHLMIVNCGNCGKRYEYFYEPY